MAELNLPADLTRFVGRRHELSEIRGLLSGARLVTLTGVGGVGKTRLALRSARDSRRAFRDGVWLVELAELREPDLLAQTVATALGLRDQSGRPPVVALGEYLSGRQLLLVLDNCEHLLDASAVLVEALLRAAPDLRILATSRQPLGIFGESAWTVPPLSMPDPDRSATLQGLSRYEAVSLFTDRATAMVPDFGLTEDNRIAVAGICHRLDGLPLAIELAVVRLRVLSPQQLLDRLTDRFPLLTGGSRTGPERQQTLRNCIEWSFELCSKLERLLWARLAVFSGGFELDAVEGICAGEDLVVGELLDLVAALVDKSVLVRQEHGPVVRYRLLETLRDFGLDKLRESGDEQVVRSRHRDWYEQLLLHAEQEWISPRQSYWVGRLAREHPNIRSAIDYCITEPRHAEAALQMAVCPWRFYWWSPGLFSEGRHWLDQALARATAPTVLRARALLLNSELAIIQGDSETGMSLFDEGQELAQRLGHPATDGRVLYARGHAALWGGDLPLAIASFEQALETLTAAPDLNQRLDILLALVTATALDGDEQRATAYHQELLGIAEPREERRHRSHSLWALGLAALHQGDLRRAADLQRQSLRLNEVLGDHQGTAGCLEALACIAAAEHRDERAATLLGATDALWQAMGTTSAAFQHVFGYHQRCERQALNALGERAYQTAFGRGMNLTFEDAVVYALEEQPQPTPPPTATAPTPLTRRELQIAELIAQGMGNKDIAKSLVIAQRTAEGHVEHILIKLGLSSRSQVAAWLAEQR